MKEELTATEKLARHLQNITGHTDYEMIEIEQINPKFNRIQSVQGLRYKVKWDNSDHDNPVVDRLDGIRIEAETLVFVNNPYPNRKPVGTGRVQYLVNDKEKNFENALSGEPFGKNLEFLASHYANKLFKIIEPKWEAVVKKRYEAIVEALKIPKPKHEFDRRYNLKGMVEDRLKLEVQHPQGVQEMMDQFKADRESLLGIIADLKSEKGIKEEQPVLKKPKKKPVAKKEESIKANFAPEEA